jgi:two-component system KDP operon response regulator KdpE
MVKTRVLLVDDEPGIRRFVGASLRAEGYEVSLATDGEEALRAVEETLPDLVILDIRMPKMDGLEVCRRTREWSHVPIIMLSAMDEEQDRVKCLRLGADDYLVKPFGIQELMARVEAVLRRAKAVEMPLEEPNFISGELEVNLAERRVTLSGQEVKLTPTEYSLLQQLVLHRGKVLTHEMLLRSVWGPEYDGEKEYIRVFVNRIRRKIGDDPTDPKYIWTQPGVGYRFLSSQ